MSWWQWVLAVIGGWFLLSIATVAVWGFVRGRQKKRKPPHVEPQIPEQRTGPQPRKKPQNWPYRGHNT